MCTHNPIQSISEPGKGICDGNGKGKANAEGIAIVALSKIRGTLLTLFLWLFPNWLSHEINRGSAR